MRGSMASSSSSQNPSAPVFIGEAAHGGYYVFHEWEDHELSVTITSAIAKLTDRSPAAIADSFPPYLDEDALDTLFTPDRLERQATESQARLTFPVGKRTVSIYSNGLILIT